MRNDQRRNAVAVRAEQVACFRLSAAFLLLASAMAIFLGMSGMARADGFNPMAEEKAQLPDSVHGKPGADRVPPGLACPDKMDLTPEDNLPSPFDADLVAWHGGHGLKPIANVSGCPDRRPARAQKV